MVFKNNKKQQVAVAYGILVLAFLGSSGCGMWNKFCGYFNQSSSCCSGDTCAPKKNQPIPSKTDDSGAVLVRANGKPLIFMNSFEEKLTGVLASNPYAQGITSAQLPVEMKKGFLNDLIDVSLIRVKLEHSIVSKDEFKNRLAQVIDAFTDSACAEAFVKELRSKFVIGSSQILAHYKENKDKYVKSSASWRVLTVQCQDAHSAAAILKKGKKASDIEAMRTFLSTNYADSNVKDHGVVDLSEHGLRLFSVPSRVRDELKAATEIDRCRSVAVGNETWILYLADYKAPVFMSFQEASEQIERVLHDEKYKAALSEELGKMRDAAHIEIQDELLQQDNASVSPIEKMLAEHLAQQDNKSVDSQVAQELSDISLAMEEKEISQVSDARRVQAELDAADAEEEDGDDESVIDDSDQESSESYRTKKKKFSK